MIKRPLRLAVLLAALAATGCATTPPAQVTRFHLNQPIAPGPIAVRPLRPSQDPSLETRDYLAAVSAELSRLGFAPSASLNTAERIATVSVDRRIDPSALPPRSPVSIGIGGGSFGGNVGVGVGTSFGIGRGRSNDTAFTQLTVQIKRASDESVVWEGRAWSRTASDSSAPEEVRRLAAALFKDFPGPSGRTVQVK